MDIFVLIGPSPALDLGLVPTKIGTVKPMTMKTVGHVRRTPWERFVRLQETTALLTKGKGQPKGVYRFSSHEECAQWTMKQRVS